MPAHIDLAVCSASRKHPRKADVIQRHIHIDCVRLDRTAHDGCTIIDIGESVFQSDAISIIGIFARNALEKLTHDRTIEGQKIALHLWRFHRACDSQGIFDPARHRVVLSGKCEQFLDARLVCIDGECERVRRQEADAPLHSMLSVRSFHAKRGDGRQLISE